MLLNASSESKPPDTTSWRRTVQSKVRGSPMTSTRLGRQTVAMAYSGKAAADAENATLFKRMKFLEEERESMTQKMMKVLSENTKLHNAVRVREAMPEVSRPVPPEASKMADSPPTFFNIGGNASEEETGWDDQVYEDGEWCLSLIHI